MKHTFLRILFCASGVLLLSSCNAARKPYIGDTKFLLDTTCTISLYDRQDKALLNDAFALCDRYEKLFSMTVKGSDIYNINHAGGRPTKVSPDTVDVIRESIGYSKESGGLFDITVGALSSLWNIEGDSPKVPPQKEIQAALKTIGYRNIEIQGDTVTLKNKNTQIDLGGIAKGFIADKIKTFLESKGVHRAIINLGGNVEVIGEKAKDTPWVVGVQQPFMARNTDVGYLCVSDQSVVTSGIYERYFIQNGIMYTHILDPRTGYPIANNLSSVTVISKQSKQGDGLSETCFLLGIDKAKALISGLKDVEAIFITKDGQIVTTQDIDKKVKFITADSNGQS